MADEKRMLELDKQVAEYQRRKLKGKLTNEEKQQELELKQDVAVVASRFRQFVEENELCTNYNHVTKTT